MVFYDEMYGMDAQRKQPLEHYQSYKSCSKGYSPEAMAGKRASYLLSKSF